MKASLASLAAIPDRLATTQGWFRISNDFIDDAAFLGPHGFAVFGVLSYHANRDGNAWPSVARLARLSGVSVRMTHTCLRRLELRGWIKATQRTGQTTVYRIWDARHALPSKSEGMHTVQAPLHAVHPNKTH